MSEVKEPIHYSPDDLEERGWETPDVFISLSGKYKGQRFQMLFNGDIIRISKNGGKAKDAKTD